MSLDRFASVGALYRQKADGQLAFLGSSFAFRKRHMFLTAAHCIGNLATAEIVLGNPFLGRTVGVVGVSRHPSADLAVLELDPAGMSIIRPFHTLGLSTPLGAEVSAVGFPEDFGPSGKQEPTGRFFRASIQRFLGYQSALGYRYHAAELNIGAPGGLSGGPVFLSGTGEHLLALVAENFESSTYLRSVEEIQTDNTHYRETVRAVINYAVCVWLPPLEKWLSEAVGPEF